MFTVNKMSSFINSVEKVFKQLLDTETKQSQYFCAPKLIEVTYNLDNLGRG